MGQQRPVRVMSPGAGDDGQPRPLTDAGFHLGQEFKGHVRQEDDGFEAFDLAKVLLILEQKAVQRNIRPQADLGESGIDVRAVFPDEGQGESGAVFGQELAVAVLQKTARRVNAFRAQVVGHGLAGQILPPVNLKQPKADHKHHKHGGHQRLEQNQTPARGLIIFNFQFYFGHGAPFFRAGQK